MGPIEQFLSTNSNGWAQGTMARSIYGHACTAQSSVAVCFCLSGMVERFYPNEQVEVNAKLIKAIKELFKTTSIVKFNDDPARVFLDVLSVVRRAGV